MADFWRGEITTRMLMSLLKGLPEDNAVSRVKNDGHTWTTMHALVWNLQHMATRNDVWQAKIHNPKANKSTKFPKWKRFPWSEDPGQQESKKWGRVEEKDRPAALAFLMSMTKKG